MRGLQPEERSSTMTIGVTYRSILHRAILHGVIFHRSASIGENIYKECLSAVPCLSYVPSMEPNSRA